MHRRDIVQNIWRPDPWWQINRLSPKLINGTQKMWLISTFWVFLDPPPFMWSRHLLSTLVRNFMLPRHCNPPSPKPEYNSMSVSCPTLHHDLRKIEIHSPILNVWDRFAEHAAPCLSRSFRPESQKRRWRFKPERFYTYWKFLRVFTQLPIKWTYDFNLSLRLYGVLSGNTCWKIFEAFGNVGLLKPGVSGNPTVSLNPQFFPSSG